MKYPGNKILQWRIELQKRDPVHCPENWWRTLAKAVALMECQLELSTYTSQNLLQIRRTAKVHVLHLVIIAECRYLLQQLMQFTLMVSVFTSMDLHIQYIHSAAFEHRKYGCRIARFEVSPGFSLKKLP